MEIMTEKQCTMGRFRFRHHALKVGDVTLDLRDKLLEIKGVLDVEVNKRVGSLLVLFDKTKTSLKNILEKIAATLGLPIEKIYSGANSAQKALTSKKARSLTKKGLMVSGVATLGALAFSEKTHVIAGLTCLGIVSLHVFQNRKTLFK